jgi:aminoglycoside phosphotransferase family enzyme/predicted kinase
MEPPFISALRRLGREQLCPMLETHISWVLLADDYAYKLKKPVDLGFVDFTTLEKRRFACEEELRLNSRLAPELYIDVVPVTGTPESPRFGGDGTPFEYAVRMREFPQETLLPNVLEREELTPAHITELARAVAAFHQSASAVDPQEPWGTPEALMKPVRDNFGQLLFPGAEAEFAPRIAALQDWSERRFRELYATFTARRAAGRIRECHGDMHLANMVLLNDRVVVFDCIEFSPRLRWIDVLSEVAFLVMDLVHRGRPDYAGRFLDEYLARTGDYAGLSVLPFYMLYRALVRCKVAALRARQSSESPQELPPIREEFEGYLSLAEEFTRPRPMGLIITHGLSGSGKSTQTEALVAETWAIRLRSDVERKRLFGLAPEDRPADPDQLYSPDASRRTYERLAELTQSLIVAGYTAVVDATFLKAAERAAFRDLAGRLQVPFIILDFDVDAAVLRERVQQRATANTDASDATVAILESQLHADEPLDVGERASSIRITPDRPLNVAEVRSRLP